MKKILAICLAISVILNIFLYVKVRSKQDVKTTTASKPIPKPLEQYTYLNLQQKTFPKSEIKVGKTMDENKDCISKMFYYQMEGKKVSGLINYPKKGSYLPVLVLIRGYVDQKIYQSGVGTSHFGEEACKNGFVTLAPDFLGYGESDNPSTSSIEERLQTYPTVLTLLSSIGSLNNIIEDRNNLVNTQKVGIWGHSNGGQIALSVLEISKKNYPTVLWAPVTKPFPYSILYYTDEFEDRGKALRKVVADFENLYDVDNYSIHSYLSSIQAPIQLHQGGSDEAVPLKWSDQFVDVAKKEKCEIEYFTYPGENHNFNQGNWPLVAKRSIDFFRNKLE